MRAAARRRADSPGPGPGPAESIVRPAENATGPAGAAGPAASAGPAEGAAPAPKAGAPRSPVWCAVTLCVLFGAAVLVDNFRAAVLVFTAEAVLAAVIAGLCGGFGWWALRRLRPVRPPLRGRSLVCLAWGSTAATGCAIMANGGLSALWAGAAGIEFTNRWGPMLTAPVNEELLKLCGLVLLSLAVPGLFRGPVDGFVLGALCGLGFQVTENWIYAMNTVVGSAATDGPGAVVQSTVSRVVVTGIGTHWAMTAVAGAGAAYWITRPGSRLRLPAAVGLPLLAVAMHALFDSPLLPGPWGPTTKALANFSLAGALWLALRGRVRSRMRGVARLPREETHPGESDAGLALLRRRDVRAELRRLPPGPDRTARVRRWRQQLDALEAHVL